MRGPCLRIDEYLNDRRHAEKYQCHGPGSQSEYQQHRRAQLDRNRQVGGGFRRQERQLVFLPEQFEGGIPVRKLGHRGIPEDCGNRDPQRDGEKRVGYTVEPLHKAHYAVVIYRWLSGGWRWVCHEEFLRSRGSNASWVR